MELQQIVCCVCTMWVLSSCAPHAQGYNSKTPVMREMKLVWDFDHNIVEVTIFEKDGMVAIGIYTERDNVSVVEGLSRFKNRLKIKKSTYINKTERLTLTILNPTESDLTAEYIARDAVTGRLQPSITYVSSNGSVTSTVGQNVYLTWNYNLNKLPSRIIFSRGQTADRKVKIAEWTEQKGFQIHGQYRLQFNKLTQGHGIDIRLTIKESLKSDFNLKYFCTIFTDDNIRYESGIELKLESPTWNDTNTDNVTSKLGDDVMFQWEYQYIFKANAVIFRKRNATTKDFVASLGFWYQEQFNEPKNFSDRLKFSLRSTTSGEIIKLTLTDTVADDFNFIYECDIILNDGQSLIWETKLLEDKPMLMESSTMSVNRSNPIHTTPIPSETNLNLVVLLPVLGAFVVVIGCTVVGIYIFKRKREKPVVDGSSNKLLNVNIVRTIVKKTQHVLK